jgi:lysophospholipase L1-like esterase
VKITLKSIFTNFLITLITLLIIFVIGEIICRTVFTFSKEGPTAINIHIFKASDIYGWGHEPKTIEKFGYGEPKPTIKINSLGFRDDEITINKPKNTKRIIILGDSFTFGMGVDQKEVFTEVLENLLNEANEKTQSQSQEINQGKQATYYEVINAGSIGYTLDNEYLLLKEKGLALDPDIVIIAFFVGNDVTEFRRHKWITGTNGLPVKLIDTEHYVDEEHRLRYKGEKEPVSYFWHFVSTRFKILQKKLGLYKSDEPTLTWPVFLDENDPHGDKRLPKFWGEIEVILKNLKKELDEKNIQLIVLAIPMDVQTNKKYWGKYSEMYFDDEAYRLARPQAKLKEICDKYKIDLIDLLPYFKEADTKDWLYFEKIDPHWTKQGHEFAAKIIKQYIEKL